MIQSWYVETMYTVTILTATIPKKYNLETDTIYDDKQSQKIQPVI